MKPVQELLRGLFVLFSIDQLISLVCWLAVLLVDLFAGGKPEAFALHLEDVNMMGEPVEQSAGEAFGTKDGGPFIKGQIVIKHRSRILKKSPVNCMNLLEDQVF